MEQLLRAAGLESYQADRYDIHGEPAIMIRLAGNAQQAWRSARAALTDHYPVLIFDAWLVADPDFHHCTAPANVLARAATLDVDARIAQMPGVRRREPDVMGAGDEGYDLDRYDVTTFGEPEALVILPRPEPWAVFAYLDPFGSWAGLEPELLVAAAHRWYDRYGATPTVVGLACGFIVSRPPTDIGDAERLATEHQALAGLTAGTTERAYARALMQLHQWCLYNRP